MSQGQTASILYKGAGPGTHWHSNDPRAAGGFTISPMPATSNGLRRHITNYSFPSAYLSFSTSFAIARSYALSGPSGVATPAQPGFVYEIDLPAITAPPALIDPVRDISTTSNGALAHGHDGSGALIAEIANGTSPLSHAHQCGGAMLAPAVSQQLRALIFAIRDAEVLLGSNVLAGAVVNRHSVY